MWGQYKMKLVDLTKCHEDSPDFRASLSQLEVSLTAVHSRASIAAQVTCSAA